MLSDKLANLEKTSMKLFRKLTLIRMVRSIIQSLFQEH